jgi:hypothetical protein
MAYMYTIQINIGGSIINSSQTVKDLSRKNAHIALSVCVGMRTLLEARSARRGRYIDLLVVDDFQHLRRAALHVRTHANIDIEDVALCVCYIARKSTFDRNRKKVHAPQQDLRCIVR